MAHLPAHLEVSSLVRLAQAAGGFAAVLHKGERDAGAILAVVRQNGANPRLFERMPRIDGDRVWTETRHPDDADERAFDSYLARRTAQDPDSWLIELDVANPERLIGLSGTAD